MSKVKQNEGGFVGTGIKEKPPRRTALTVHIQLISLTMFHGMLLVAQALNGIVGLF